MEKVFCSDCINYYKSCNLIECNYPLNIIVKHDWECEWLSNIKPPREINKKNNCKWYKNRPNGWSKGVNTPNI